MVFIVLNTNTEALSGRRKASCLLFACFTTLEVFLIWHCTCSIFMMHNFLHRKREDYFISGVNGGVNRYAARAGRVLHAITYYLQDVTTECCQPKTNRL